jgi:hypothetical protein
MQSWVRCVRAWAPGSTPCCGGPSPCFSCACPRYAADALGCLAGSPLPISRVAGALSQSFLASIADYMRDVACVALDAEVGDIANPRSGAPLSVGPRLAGILPVLGAPRPKPAAPRSFPRLFVLWRSLSEWCEEVQAFVAVTGRGGSVCTLWELVEGEDVVGPGAVGAGNQAAAGDTKSPWSFANMPLALFSRVIERLGGWRGRLTLHNTCEPRNPPPPLSASYPAALPPALHALCARRATRKSPDNCS